MGRKLDLSGLTDEETEHVLQVVQRDFNLRKKEEEQPWVAEMKQKLEEEGSKCSILAKHQKFVEHCCMRCCAPFTFLLNTRRHCSDCKFNVCKGCCSFLRHEKAWVCCVCQQARLLGCVSVTPRSQACAIPVTQELLEAHLAAVSWSPGALRLSRAVLWAGASLLLRTQSLEWFYSNVKSRFKRFGSAKVLKNLYRKHRLETGASFDVLGTGFFESHLENDGSISGSDSSFPWQPEGHSMMDTLAVALRVAEEAIEEAICKAEAHGDSLDKQKEAAYLQDHREELAEELAATILQKIIRKQKRRSKQHMEEDPEGPQPPGCSLKAKDEGSAAAPGDHSVPTTLWRSQSAFSFPGGDTRKTSALEAAARCFLQSPHQERTPAALATHLVTALSSPPAGAAPVLQSPDGNWVALKDSVAPPAHLLAARKSTTLQALEVPPRAASAYQELGSDSEEDFDWNAALSKLCLQAQGADHGAPATSPSLGASPNPEAMGSDSETSSAGSSRDAGRRARFSWPPRRGPRNPAAERLRLQGELDVNFNPQAASAETSDSSEPEEAPQAADWRARQWRRAHLNPKELGTEQCGPHTCTQELHTHQGPSDLSETDISNEAADSRSSTDTAEEKRRAQLYELAMKMSEKETSSGEDPESEPKTGPENQESLSSEENAQSVQDELRKFGSTPGPELASGGSQVSFSSDECPARPLPRLPGSHRSWRTPPVLSQRARRADCLTTWQLGAVVTGSTGHRPAGAPAPDGSLRMGPGATAGSGHTCAPGFLLEVGRRVCSAQALALGSPWEAQGHLGDGIRGAGRQGLRSNRAGVGSRQLGQGRASVKSQVEEVEEVEEVEKEDEKYSAVSLCNISTEVLKVITATEELVAGSTGPRELPPVPAGSEEGTFPLRAKQARLEEQLTSLEESQGAEGPTQLAERRQQTPGVSRAVAAAPVSEELALHARAAVLSQEPEKKAQRPLSSLGPRALMAVAPTHAPGRVYLAAGTVYGLEGQLAALEDAACSIHSGTQDTELAELEDQVAEAAAQVHHAELQISDIESRISALTIAGLNIAPCMRLTRKQEQRRRSQVQTIDTSRQQRRKLPAPPVKAGKTEASSVTTIKTFHSNFILQGSSISRPTESGTQDLTVTITSGPKPFLCSPRHPQLPRKLPSWPRGLLGPARASDRLCGIAGPLTCECRLYFQLLVETTFDKREIKTVHTGMRGLVEV
ncbi:Rab effector MyRIP [Heterocephalus glaber]|uniref:Rab effector MyRIP n=1 Tax=Heterocephalus glaber TaxID=10181 RepID=G5ALW8_HETGA|nr:Rab effector MyRIP [Heterocephalus glaber]